MTAGNKNLKDKNKPLNANDEVMKGFIKDSADTFEDRHCVRCPYK